MRDLAAEHAAVRFLGECGAHVVARPYTRGRAGLAPHYRACPSVKTCQNEGDMPRLGIRFAASLLWKVLIWGQAADTIQSRTYEWRHRPVAPSARPTNPLALRLWTARGDAFDRDSGAPYPLDDPNARRDFEAAHSGAGSANDRYSLGNPIPVKESDAVVVASFSQWEVGFSPSRRSFYTVIRFRVERVFKSLCGAPSAGATIDSLLPGGAAEIEGTTISYQLENAGDVPLQEQGRYVSFLKYNRSTESYTILKHWQLQGGRVVAVDLVEKDREVTGKSEYAGRPEPDFIAAVVDAVGK